MTRDMNEVIVICYFRKLSVVIVCTIWMLTHRSIATNKTTPRLEEHIRGATIFSNMGKVLLSGISWLLSAKIEIGPYEKGLNGIQAQLEYTQGEIFKCNGYQNNTFPHAIIKEAQTF